MLRPPGMAAAKAEYWISVRRRKTGPKAGEVIIGGQVETNMAALLSARDGRAWLTLETGAIYEVELHHLTTTTAEFRVLPPFDSLLD
ncbi:MAG: hypothetical protein K0S00_4430 [Xanthobacteraceae bacterium]|jgi:hypothetical protein|nr:hypothetical protein [Xanthobacteraceae bacterium]